MNKREKGGPQEDDLEKRLRLRTETARIEHANASSPPDPLSALADKVGNLGRQMLAACHNTADEIRDAGNVVVQIAGVMAEEAESVGGQLRAHVSVVTSEMQRFVVMTENLADSVKAARSVVQSTATEKAPKQIAAPAAQPAATPAATVPPPSAPVANLDG
jgi:hypothetical protein